MTMTAPFYDFYNYATEYNKPDTVKRPAHKLYNAIILHTDVAPITIDGSGAVTYPPNLNGPVTRFRTTSLTRLARYLSQKVPDLADVNWQPLQDEIVKWASMELGSNYWSFEEVTGADLVEAYRTGPHSCMRGRNAQLQLYTINPEKVGLLKIYRQGKYEGRALVWTADDGRRFLDRVYPGNGTTSFAARRYAKSQGWLHLDYDGVYSAKDLGNFDVTLKHVTNRRIPYLDNLKFILSCNDNTLTLTTDGRRNGVYLRTIGNYTGFASELYSTHRYLDGAPVVHPLITDGGRSSFGHAQMTLASVYNTRGTSATVYATRPDDVLYRVDSEPHYRASSYVMEIDGLYYRRSDLRKRRGVDEYVPKAGVVGMTALKKYTLSNGATTIHLGVK